MAPFLAGCAQVSSPTGGPVDEAPPVLLAVDPPAGSTNWPGGTVRFVFDEFVQIKNVRDQWLISPPTSTLPSYRLRGKVLELDWSEVELDSGVTVVLDFGESVVDLHEGNPLQNGVWAASTGPKLDTMKWGGKLVDRDFAEPVAGARVLLFPEGTHLDSIVSGKRPQYVGVSNERGEVAIGYLATGGYDLWAISDENKDWRWQPGESVAWGGVWQTEDSLPMQLTLFPTHEAERVVAERGVQDSTGLIALHWKGGAAVKHLNWQGSNGEKLEWQVVDDSLFAWGPNAEALVWSWERGEEQGIDTVDLKNLPTVRSAKPDRLPRGKVVAGTPRILHFNRPLQSFRPASWNLYEDSTDVWIDSLVLLSPFEIQMFARENPGRKYRLTASPEGITTVDDQIGDSIETSWTTWPEDHLAELLVTVYGAAVPGQLILEDASGRALATIPLAAEDSVVWRIQDLMPGKVNLTWESRRFGGDTFEEVDVQKTLPGDVRLQAPGGLELRSNWTMEWIWEVDTTKFPNL